MNWINCNDRLPDLSVRVLVVDDAGYISIMCRNDYEKPYSWTDFETPYATAAEIVAWMPLPEPTLEMNG